MFPKVQRSRKKKKEEKKKLKHCQIVTATDFYIVRRSFFIILWLFFVHSSFFIQLVFAFKDLNMIYGPLGVPFIVCVSSSPSSIISDLFLCLKRVSTDRSYHNLV